MSCYWVSFLVESLPCGHPSSLKHKIGRRNYGSYHWCCQRIWQEKIKIRSRKFMGLLAGCVPCKKVHMRQKQGLNYPALQEVGQTGSQQQQFPEGCRTLLTHSVSLLQQSCHRSCKEYSLTCASFQPCKKKPRWSSGCSCSTALPSIIFTVIFNSLEEKHKSTESVKQDILPCRCDALQCECQGLQKLVNIWFQCW